MNKVIKNSFLILALLSVLFTSCKKEYEIPPINDVPVGDVLTIEDILNMAPNSTFPIASVYGVVTADEQSGNLYKVLFIQDRASGKAIELRLNTSSAARIGDSIRVCLDSTIVFSYYHNLPQLSGIGDKGFSPDGHLVIYPENKPIEPKVVTIADIMTGQYIASLVRLDSVEFVEKNATFCETGETTNRHLIDASSPNSSDNFVVRTSNYANFAYDYMPLDRGSLEAIVSVYNSTYQLLLISKNKMYFNEWGGPAAPAGDLQDMPYLQSFESNFGTYVTYSVEGNQTWAIEYSSAWITGHEGGSGGTDYANEDWLISSPVAVTGVDHAKAVINYAAKYTAPVEGDVTFQVSTDYEYGKDPRTANWTELPDRLENNSTGSAWTFTDKEVSLDQFIGQNVYFAVKFISTTTGSRTIEIKSINITEGEAGGTPTPPGPGPGEGSGTADDPYNVAAGINLQGQEIIGWVHGYIVGAVKSGVTSVSANDQINWSGSFDSQTNVVIADDPACQEITQCVIVNLPAGKPLRTQVNLQDNPGNLGKQLAVNGKLRTYFGQAGLRDSGGTEEDFVLEGGTPTPPTPPTTIFSESFASGQGGFNIQDVILPSGLTYVWSHSSQYSCMKASAFVNGQNYATESWLVSPSINLAGVSTASLSFEQAVNYAAPNGLSVMISTNYSGDVTAAIWTELNLSAWPAGNNWTFIPSTADLTPYVGQTVNIGFKYTSTSSASATWEVKNVVVE